VAGKGPRLLLFSHGFGTAQAVWRKVVQGLPPEFSAVLFDLPGASPHLPRDFQVEDYRSIDRFAQDLLDLMAELHIERCEYVGHSLSGMVGLLAAKAAPEKFERLVLLNASPRYIDDDDYAGGFSHADVEGLIRSMETNYRSWVAGFAPLAIYAPVPEAVEDFSQDLLAMRPDVAARIAQFIFTSDYRALLPTIEAPVCLIHSRSDIAVPESVAHYMTAHLPNSSLHWIDALGHLPHISAPDEVLKALLACIAD
jgi:sigma-B regulation protein RsbQ